MPSIQQHQTEFSYHNFAISVRHSTVHHFYEEKKITNHMLYTHLFYDDCTQADIAHTENGNRSAFKLEKAIIFNFP